MFQWLQREHGFLHRYLAVVNQATHDYSYGYWTPQLLMPVTIDVFTGYMAWLHEAEDRFLYPALANHLNEEQEQGIRLLRTEEDEEAGSVKSWQQQLVQYEAGKKKLPELADTIDYLGRLINRHIVLQEQRVFPLLDQLTPKEQATILKQLNAFERETLGATGRSRYEQLLVLSKTRLRRACRCATPPVLAAADYRRRRLRAGGGPGCASPAKPARSFSTEQQFSLISREKLKQSLIASGSYSRPRS